MAYRYLRNCPTAGTVALSQAVRHSVVLPCTPLFIGGVPHYAVGNGHDAIIGTVSKQQPAWRGNVDVP